MRNFILGCALIFLLIVGALWTMETRWATPYAFTVTALLLFLLRRPKPCPGKYRGPHNGCKIQGWHHHV